VASLQTKAILEARAPQMTSLLRVANTVPLRPSSLGDRGTVSLLAPLVTLAMLGLNFHDATRLPLRIESIS
jgi:hypothetical protein